MLRFNSEAPQYKITAFWGTSIVLFMVLEFGGISGSNEHGAFVIRN